MKLERLLVSTYMNTSISLIDPCLYAFPSSLTSVSKTCLPTPYYNAALPHGMLCLTAGYYSTHF